MTKERSPASSSGLGPPSGLRARKKAKTREALQQHAFRLFRAQGYGQTTITEIARAAKISPATFFRYFPTKEDVAMYDVTDPAMLAALGAQPHNISTLEALRRTIREAVRLLPPASQSAQEEREALIRSVPELRMRVLDEYIRSAGLLKEWVADRTGLRSNDPQAEALTAAIFGAVVSAYARGARRSFRERLGQVERSLSLLESGFPRLSARPPLAPARVRRSRGTRNVAHGPRRASRQLVDRR